MANNSHVSKDLRHRSREQLEESVRAAFILTISRCIQ